MLFSNDKIAEFVNEYFEPTWQNVRDVPIVTIDFGDGKKITRTLHGNIATHVCTADGSLLDVLPGIYQPATYLDRLGEFVQLHRWVSESQDRAKRLAQYHRLQAEALAAGKPTMVIGATVPRTKKVIEGAVKLVLAPRRADSTKRAAATAVESTLSAKEDVALWKSLAEDTQLNEKLRRRTIHEYLAKQGLVAPQEITKWLYREVLHADIDDPYLGLGKMLFASYPFNDK